MQGGTHDGAAGGAQAAPGDGLPAAEGMAAATVLLVEDDPGTAQLVRDILEERGYRVRVAGDGTSARAALRAARPDLILLDLMLPDADGLLLCREWKSRPEYAALPIIICTASGQKRDRILGLKLGADDFITKPFDVDELEARVEVVLRRWRGAWSPPAGAGVGETARESGQAPADADEQRALPVSDTGEEPPPRAGGADEDCLGELCLDHDRRQLTLGDAAVGLTPLEYSLLSAFIEKRDRVASRQVLARAAWGTGAQATERSLEAHVRRLRAKLRRFGPSAPDIVAVRGHGYRLTAPQRSRVA